MSGRLAFLVLASAAIGLALVTAVVRPAVERGGWGELVAVAAAVLAVLLAERWLRSR